VHPTLDGVQRLVNRVFAFALASLLGWGIVYLTARRVRGRPFARFVSVLLGTHTLISIAVARRAGILLVPLAYLQLATFVHFAFLAKPAMRPALYRAFVSVPASWFLAGTLLALLVVPFSLLGAPAWLFAVPYAIAFIGLGESLFAREEEVDVVLDGTHVESLRRHRVGVHADGDAPDTRTLHIVQITDPHLGAFMSVARLRAICARAVARNPDLVLLTGDFLTMESQGDPSLLARALEPLRSLEGRTFACFGNHDHEAPAAVRGALASAGVRLLVDDMARVDTAVGTLEILGFDFVWRERQRHVLDVSARFPRTQGVPRVALLHDPGAFRHLPDDTADLVLSGHTHGGQLGLLTLGLPHTFVSAFTSIPDHGLWGLGRLRLYVHRGTGHYGFPIRLGVPSEQSLMRVHVPSAVWSPMASG